MNQNNQVNYSNLNEPEPMGGGSTKQTNSNQSGLRMPNNPPTYTAPQPSNNQVLDPLKEHKSPVASYLLMFFLFIILISAVLIFISWKGWISLGGIEKLWGGGNSNPTPTPTATKTISPSISTSPEVSPESSPIITGNINDSQRKTDLANIKEALNKYFTDNSAYPISNGTIKTNEVGNILTLKLVPQYLVSLPVDPTDPQYYYGYKSDGTTFELTSVLEDKTDPAGIQVGQYYLYKVTN